MRKRLPVRLYWIIVFLYCFVIFALSCSSNPMPRNVRKLFSDWFLHGVEYGILGFFLTGALRFSLKIKSFRVLFISTVTLASLYGATDEIHQLFIPKRQCDWRDWLADTIGSFCGVLVFWFIVRMIPKKKVNLNASDQSILRTSI